MKRLLLVFVLYMVAATVVLTGHQSSSGAASLAAPPSEQQPGAPASASQIPAVWLEPVVSTVQVDQVFTVTLMISGVSDLAAFEFDLVYAPSVVEVVTMTLGSFLKVRDPEGLKIMSAGPLIDNASGRSIFAGFTWGHEPGVSGQGDLAHVRLRARAAGTSALALEDVQLTDPEATVLAVTSQDGSVIVGSTLNRRLYLPLAVKVVR